MMRARASTSTTSLTLYLNNQHHNRSVAVLAQRRTRLHSEATCRVAASPGTGALIAGLWEIFISLYSTELADLQSFLFLASGESCTLLSR